MTDTPQISYPFEILSTGLVREVEQDTVDEIAMSVEIILRYPIGSRDELPDFGVPDVTFLEASVDVSKILASHVARWEDRVPILIEERPAVWNQMVRNFIARIEGKV